MSTYHLEKPMYLDEAMRSIWEEQTRKPDQIILVKDGPLTQELDSVIEKWEHAIGCSKLVVVANDKNKGLALSLNDGIKEVKCELIARMDTDDISLPNRFEIQEKFMEDHPEVDILGGSLQEFNDEGSLHYIRTFPTTVEQIKASIHRSSPLGHPTVMFRRRFFDEGFTYKNTYHICEDIVLWFDALCAGKIINNTPEVLIKFRRNASMMHRRSKEKAWSEFKAYNNGIYRLYGVFTTRYLFSVFRLIFRLLPSKCINYIYTLGKLRNILSK